METLASNKLKLKTWTGALVILVSLYAMIWGQWSNLIWMGFGLALGAAWIKPSRTQEAEAEENLAVAEQPERRNSGSQGLLSMDMYGVFHRQIQGPLRNLDQIHTLIQGATTQMWPGLRDINHQADRQVEQLEQLRQKLPGKLRESAEKLETIRSSIGDWIRESAYCGKAVLDTQDRIDDLGAKLKLVDRQLEALGWIADQTNLVSVNAQIEAARLGADGKGFHVIAAEVQQLASMSRQVSEEISQLIRAANQHQEVASSACQLAVGVNLGSMVPAQTCIGEQIQSLTESGSLSEQSIESLTEIAMHLCARATRFLGSMQFEDISTQVICRSKEDLLALDKILSELSDGRTLAASSSAQVALEARVASHEMEAMHRPEQVDLQPGEIELF